MIGYSTIDFFEKKSSKVNIFSTREDGTVKKKMFAGRCFWKKKNDCRGALIKKNCLQRKMSHASPLRGKLVRPLWR